jgi:hypothetical protein
MGGGVPPLPNTPSWRGAQGEHRVNLPYKSYTRTNIPSFFYVIPASLHILLLRSTSFLMPSAKNVFGCARSHVRIASLTSSQFANRHPRDISLSGPKIW